MDEELQGRIAYRILISLLIGKSGRFSYDRVKRAIRLAEEFDKENGREFAQTLTYDLAEHIY